MTDLQVIKTAWYTDSAFCEMDPEMIKESSRDYCNDSKFVGTRSNDSPSYEMQPQESLGFSTMLASLPVTGRNVFVHVGFYKAYKAIRKELLKLLKDIYSDSGETQVFYLHGHSLGGCLCYLLALDIVQFVRRDKIHGKH